MIELLIASLLFAIGWVIIGAVSFILIHLKYKDFTTNDLPLVLLFGILGPLTAFAWLCAWLIMWILESDFINGISNPKILIKKR